MMRFGHGAFRLAPAVLLAAACAAASATGDDAPGSPLVIDPGAFAPMPAGRAFPAGVARDGRGHQGPRIALLSPGHDAVLRAGDPVVLYAEFLPAADGTAPDMETVGVRVRKGLRGKDLTEWMKPYVAGTALRVPAVDFLGHGEFWFELDVLDEQGRMGEVAFRVTFRIELRDALRRDGGM